MNESAINIIKYKSKIEQDIITLEELVTVYSWKINLTILVENENEKEEKLKRIRKLVNVN